MRGLLLTSILLFACGFVRVGQEDGRWWFVTDAGERTLLSGVGGVRFTGGPCELSGTHPYLDGLRAKGVSAAAWEGRTGRRLRDWGFNLVTIDNRIPTFGLHYAVNVSLGRDAARQVPDGSVVPFRSVHEPVFPNVFSPAFADACRRLAKERCAVDRDDPMLVGRFIDNELMWTGGRYPDGLFGLVAALPDGHSAKVAQQAFLAARGWTGRPVDEEIRTAFLAHVAERYFAVTTAAIREADPHHLVMGCRFAGIHSLPDEVWAACGKYCDVVSVNVYPAADLDHGYVREQNLRSWRSIAWHFDRIYRAAQKPVIVTEWSFPGLDAGLPSTSGAGQRHRTQKSRAEATELFARVMCGLPQVVGFVHFAWGDQPSTGVSAVAPENCNYGLVNVNDEPYGELVAAFRRIHDNLSAWHLAGEPPRRTRPPNDVGAVARALARPGCRAGSFVRRPDGSFVAENGAFRLEGRPGGDGLVSPIGGFRPWIHEVCGGRKLWTPVARLVSANGGVTNGVLTFTCTFAGGQKGNGRQMTARFCLPAGRPHFLFEPVSVSNDGGTPTEVRSVYGILDPPGGRTYSAGLCSEGRPIENIWGGWAYAAWIDTASQRYFGCVGNERDNVRVRYWKEGENLHGDAVVCLPDPYLLPPHGVCTLPERPYLVLTFGLGGNWGWQRRLAELGVD